MFRVDVPSEVEGVVDVCVIGAGPAGMTAAVYTARKNLSTAIVTMDIGGQVAWTLGIENYMGYQYVTGRELTAKFEEQVGQYPVTVVNDEVTMVAREHDSFRLTTAGGREIEARAVIVATGKRPRKLGAKNEQKFVGRGLSYCATCDGPFFTKMDVAVCGGGNSAIQAAVEMAGIASRVYVVSRGPWRADGIILEKANALSNIERWTGYEVLEVLGDKVVEGLRIREKASGREERLAVKGVFVEVGLVPNSEFLRGVVELNERGEVVVDCRCVTNVPGMFAAGDVTNVHDKQIVIAAGDGAKAALSAHEYLLRK